MKAKTLGREGGYNCIVCIKQVPDTKQVTGEAMKADGTINRAALPAISIRKTATPSRRRFASRRTTAAP